MKFTWKNVADLPLKYMNLVIYLITAVSVMGVIVFWRMIPDQVPQHFNAAGNIDAYCGKGILIFLLVMMLFIAGMHAIIMYITPNFSEKDKMFGKKAALKATDDDTKTGIKYTLYLIVICDLACEAMFAYLIVCDILVRKTGVWFIPVLLIVLFAPMIYCFWKMYQLKSQILKR